MAMPAKVTLEFDPVTARILDRMLVDVDAACEGMKRARLASAAERDLACEDQLVAGYLRAMIAEQLGDPRCKYCGQTHENVPQDLCELARREYRAATALQQLLTPTEPPES